MITDRILRHSFLLIIYTILGAWPRNDQHLETPVVMLKFRLCCLVENLHRVELRQWNILTLQIPLTQQIINASVHTANAHTTDQ